MALNNHYIILRDSVDQEFGQGTAGMAPPFIMWGALAGKMPVAAGCSHVIWHLN